MHLVPELHGEFVVAATRTACPATITNDLDRRSNRLLIYIWCDSVAQTIKAVLAHGGELVQDIGADAPEITARFRDPGGNVVGLYESR